MRIADLMTTDVVTVHPDTPLKEAARVMCEARVGGLPVTDSEGRLVGIITEADFLDKAVSRAGLARPRLLDAVFGKGTDVLAEADIVMEAMTDDVITIRETDSVIHGARLMASGDINRLPVVDDDGRLTGILSRADVLRAFARDDEEIQVEVEALLAGGLVPVASESLAGKVENGVVTLSGLVDSRSEAHILEQLVGRIDGVIRVESEFDWNIDDSHPDTPWYMFSQEGAER